MAKMVIVEEESCIHTQHNNKPILISNLYRLPNPATGITLAEHTEHFLTLLDTHLAFLNSSNKDSFVLTDANINLAALNLNQLSIDYFNTILSNGFLPLNTKSTRIQGNSHSLIDHILSNSHTPESINTGTIIQYTRMNVTGVNSTITSSLYSRSHNSVPVDRKKLNKTVKNIFFCFLSKNTYIYIYFTSYTYISSSGWHFHL